MLGQKMNSYAKYQEWFEEQAKKESRQYAAMSKAQLLACFASRDYGITYQIWYEAIKKLSLGELAGIYLKVLYSEEDYLVRYHCANSLIELSGLSQFQAVDLSGDRARQRKENLREFFRLIEEKLATAPEDHHVEEIEDKPKASPGCCGEGEPDANPNLLLLDSTCIVPSQFSASVYYEIWQCQKCQRKWGITICRDGFSRNCDPPEWEEIQSSV